MFKLERVYLEHGGSRTPDKAVKKWKKIIFFNSVRILQKLYPAGFGRESKEQEQEQEWKELEKVIPWNRRAEY